MLCRRFNRTNRLCCDLTMTAGLLGLAMPVAGAAEVAVHQLTLPLSPAAESIAIEPFDDQGGTRELVSVELTATLTIGANVTAENDSDFELPGWTLDLAGFATVELGPLSLFALFETVETTGPVPPSDGVSGAGPDFVDFGTVAVTRTLTETTSVDLDSFASGVPLNAELFSAAGVAVDPVTGDATVVIDGFEVAASISVVYHTRPIADACPTDLDDSGQTDVTDLLALFQDWGECAGCVSDIDGDGHAGYTDLLAILLAWGDCE
ncbi:MAG: hypothetical protein HKO59_13455 [Phycisphaerales bacterium]|nr:hypothetical protein [Phycisphaerales bacterium]